MSDLAISVKNVQKSFRLPYEKYTGLKYALIHFRFNKQYEMLPVIKEMSFDIKKGEFFGIVGRNGSGKSTLLKLLAHIYTPSNGQILVTGSLTPFIELGVGFNPELTGRENVYLNGALLGFDRREMDEMYDSIVGFAELEKFMDQKLKNYSTGMQVRLAFSIAIRAESDILLVDEVLAVGDAAFQQKCFDYFEELKRGDRTVVFVTHDMGAVRRFCNRAIYIEDGHITHIGTPAEIADVYLEENMQSAQAAAKADGKELKKHTVLGKIAKRTEKGIEFEISYRSGSMDELYVGISVIKDGIAVGEINSLDHKALLGEGKITFSLDTTNFNPGVYRITAALFKKENRELIAGDNSINQFIVKGTDMTRGAAIKLANTWRSHD